MGLNEQTIHVALLVSAVILVFVLIVSIVSAFNGGTCFQPVGFQTPEEEPDNSDPTPAAEEATEPERSRFTRDSGVTCMANFFANGAVSQSIQNVINATSAHDDCDDRVDGGAIPNRPIPNRSQATGAVSTKELERLRDLSFKNLSLMLMCLLYVVVNIVCAIINCNGEGAREYYEGLFLLLEFWGACV